MSIWALDLLGMGSPKWDMQSTLKKFPRDWGCGVFDTGWAHAFGDPRENLRALIAQRSLRYARIQVWWADNHQFAPVEHLKKRLPVWEKFANRHKTTQVFLSPSCEYKSTDKGQVEEAIHLVKTLAPSCTPILTPMGGSYVVPGVMTEEHGRLASAKRDQFASWDGDSCIDGNIEGWKITNGFAEMLFLWVELFNMKEAHNTLTPDRRTASPRAADYEAVLRLAKSIGQAPKPVFAGEIRPFQAPYLYKVWAEDLAGNNPRDKKPLIIIDSKVGEVEAVSFKNDKICTFKIYGAPGSYPGGLTRYYSGVPHAANMYGWEIADRCKQLSGSEWGWFRAGDVFWGPVNFSFRRGFYQ